MDKMKYYMADLMPVTQNEMMRAIGEMQASAQTRNQQMH